MANPGRSILACIGRVYQPGRLLLAHAAATLFTQVAADLVASRQEALALYFGEVREASARSSWVVASIRSPSATCSSPM